MKLSNFTLAIALTLGFLSAGHAANLVYWVDVSTASLVSNSDAPFGLDLALIKGVGSIGNTVTLSNFTFTNSSGTVLSPTGTLVYNTGTESGSMASSVILTSGAGSTSGTVNEYAEQLPAGTANIWFKVTSTNNAESVGTGSPTPDQFTAMLDDKTGAPIATTAADGISLASDSIVASAFLSQVQTFSSVAPDGGATASISATPEPGHSALLLMGALGILARRRRKVAVQNA